MPLVRLSLAVAMGIAVLAAAIAPTQAADWKLVDTRDGVEVFKSEVAGSGVVAMKGVGAVDAPVWKVASILLDTARAPEWVDSLKDSHVVRRLGGDSYVEYNRITMPLIINDREFVSQVHIDVDARAGRFALVYRPTSNAPPPLPHTVRGEILSGRFEAVRNGRGETLLTAEVQCDPKGALPTWIVNLFQRNWPVTTFNGLRRQAAKPDITMPKVFADVLEPTKAF